MPPSTAWPGTAESQQCSPLHPTPVTCPHSPKIFPTSPTAPSKSGALSVSPTHINILC